EAAAEILGCLLANTWEKAAYLRLLCLSHRFPGLEQGTETSLHFLIGFSDACLQRAAHGGLKAAEKALLLRGEFLSQIGLRCFQASFGFAHGLLRFGFKAAEFLARLALNFVDESRGGGFRGFAEQRAGTLESVAYDFFHLVLRVADEI